MYYSNGDSRTNTITTVTEFLRTNRMVKEEEIARRTELDIGDVNKALSALKVDGMVHELQNRAGFWDSTPAFRRQAHNTAQNMADWKNKNKNKKPNSASILYHPSSSPRSNYKSARADRASRRKKIEVKFKEDMQAVLTYLQTLVDPVVDNRWETEPVDGVYLDEMSESERFTHDSTNPAVRTTHEVIMEVFPDEFKDKEPATCDYKRVSAMLYRLRDDTCEIDGWYVFEAVEGRDRARRVSVWRAR